MDKKNGDGNIGALDVTSKDWITSLAEKTTTRRESLKMAGVVCLTNVTC